SDLSFLGTPVFVGIMGDLDYRTFISRIQPVGGARFHFMRTTRLNATAAIRAIRQYYEIAVHGRGEHIEHFSGAEDEKLQGIKDSCDNTENQLQKIKECIEESYTGSVDKATLHR
ncbi:hypothetical protein EC973_008682, partial [Apophysomyces ossiformis]